MNIYKMHLAGKLFGGSADLSDIYTKEETDALLDEKSNINHTHDDRYYTETEIDIALSGKAASDHVHDDRYYTETETDTLLNGKSNTGHTHTTSQITDFPANVVQDSNYVHTDNNFTNAYQTKLDGINIVVLTQAQYDALSSPDTNTLYLIPEEAN